MNAKNIVLFAAFLFLLRSIFRSDNDGSNRDPSSLRWPLKGKITSPFGERIHPVTLKKKFHGGIDIAATERTEVRAAGTGTVSRVFYDKTGGGNVLEIDHGGGFKTLYMHLHSSIAQTGQRVNQGEIVALSGNTGTSTGPHLHYEVRRDGIKVNPLIYTK